MVPERGGFRLYAVQLPELLRRCTGLLAENRDKVADIAVAAKVWKTARCQSMQTSLRMFRLSRARPVPTATVESGSSTTVMGREVSSRRS